MENYVIGDGQLETSFPEEKEVSLKLTIRLGSPAAYDIVTRLLASPRYFIIQSP